MLVLPPSPIAVHKVDIAILRVNVQLAGNIYVQRIVFLTDNTGVNAQVIGNNGILVVVLIGNLAAAGNGNPRTISWRANR